MRGRRLGQTLLLMTCYSKLSAACGLRRGNENPSVLEIKHNNVDKVIAALLSGGETGSGNPEWTANVSKRLLFPWRRKKPPQQQLLISKRLLTSGGNYCLTVNNQ